MRGLQLMHCLRTPDKGAATPEGKMYLRVSTLGERDAQCRGRTLAPVPVSLGGLTRLHLSHCRVELEGAAADVAGALCPAAAPGMEPLHVALSVLGLRRY